MAKDEVNFLYYTCFSEMLNKILHLIFCFVSRHHTKFHWELLLRRDIVQ